MMKTLSTLVLVLLLTQLTACDAKKDLNQPRTEARTMIIGGVPVYDRDYKLPSQEMAFNQKTPPQADAY